MAWMYATHPKMAKRWTKEQEKKQGKGSFKRLPKKAKSKDEVIYDPILTYENNDATGLSN